MWIHLYNLSGILFMLRFKYLSVISWLLISHKLYILSYKPSYGVSVGL